MDMISINSNKLSFPGVGGVKSYLGKFYLVYLPLGAVYLSVTACGRQPDFLEPPAILPAIELATTTQIAAGAVTQNSYIVMFRGENTPESIYFSSFHDEYQHHYLRLLDEVASDARVKDIDVLTTLDLSRKQSAQWSPEFDAPAALRLFWDDDSADNVTGVMSRVDFSTQKDASEVLKEWEEKGLIWYAEPNGKSSLSEDGTWAKYSTAYKALASPDGLWWHKNINLTDAMAAIDKIPGRATDDDLRTSPPVIAVLDSGVDYDHPLLKANSIWGNNTPGASGCEGDVHGCNTTAPSKGSLGNGDVWPVGTTAAGQSLPTTQKGGHGTHVAGIIAATASADRGVGGVCPVCKVMIVKVADSEAGDTNADPKIRDDSQIRGLKYITRFKKNNANVVRVANSSFGKYSRSRSVAVLVDALRKTGNGTIVIAAASNEDSMIRSYPAALSNAVAVAALREDNQKAKYSNFGPWVDIAAPGGKGNGDTGDAINSTWPGDQIYGTSGTSMAAPVVAGAVGLYLAVFPNADLTSLHLRLLDTADGSIYTGEKPAAQFNAQNYYQKISGEDARRPLLGSGILDVNNFITNTRKVAVGKPLDRVSPGCGTIGLAASSKNGLYWLGILLASPLMMQFLWKRKMTRKRT